MYTEDGYLGKGDILSSFITVIQRKPHLDPIHRLSVIENITAFPLPTVLAYKIFFY